MSKKEQREAMRKAMRRWNLGRRLGDAVLEGIPPRPAVAPGARALQYVIAEVEQERHAERGRKFGSEKPPRTLSRLYHAAVAILARDGVERSAHHVLTQLKDQGVVTAFDTNNVRWTDAHNEARTTQRKKFEDRLSFHRARLRRCATSSAFAG